MMVPAAEGDGNVAHACLDQSAGQKRALAKGRAAVAVADAVAFLLDRERAAGLAGEDHLLGPAAELVVGCDLVVALDLTRQSIHGVEQSLASLHALRRF